MTLIVIDFMLVLAFVLPVVVVCVFPRRRYHRCLHLGHPAFRSFGCDCLLLSPFFSFSSSSSSSRSLFAVLALLAGFGALAVQPSGCCCPHRRRHSHSQDGWVEVSKSDVDDG